jgi:predicted KAP-like P-loop ATPase
MTSDESSPRLDPDQPIRNSGQDALKRDRFVSALAATARSAPTQSGFVIGLTGGWGEGKSSVVNLLIEELKGKDDPWMVVEFNPWLFSGSEQLTMHFLQELAKQLRPISDGLARAADLLERYSSAVGDLDFLPGVGGVARTSARLAQAGADALRAEEVSARGLRDQVAEALAASEHRILVVVDDLDRLDQQEIADVVRLIRLVGNFPNVVYLMAFDREKVECALGGSPDKRALGRDYLEKVVQVIHPLPPVETADLNRLLRDRVEGVVGDFSKFQFDRRAYEAIYTAGFRSLFNTVRDVQRFANNLPTVLELVGDEVELSDLLALEAIRLFEPAAFETLMGRPGLLAGELGGSSLVQQKADAEQAATEQFRKALADATQPAQLEELVVELFPGTARFLRRMTYGEDTLQVFRRGQRVAHPDVLSIYLQRGLPEGTLATVEVAAALADLDDRERLRDRLGALDADGLANLLGRLRDYQGEFRLEHAEVAVEEFLRILDDLDRDGSGRPIGPYFELRSAIRSLLADRPAEEVEAIASRVQPPSLSANAELLHILGSRKRITSEILVGAESLAALERELANEILAATPETLAGEKDLRHLLHRAQEADPEEFPEKLVEHLANDRLLLAWLSHYVIEVVGQEISYQLNWPALAEKVGQEVLADHIRNQGAALSVLAQNQRQRAAVEQALEYADAPEKAEEDMRPYRDTFS